MVARLFIGQTMSKEQSKYDLKFLKMMDLQDGGRIILDGFEWQITQTNISAKTGMTLDLRRVLYGVQYRKTVNMDDLPTGVFDCRDSYLAACIREIEELRLKMKKLEEENSDLMLHEMFLNARDLQEAFDIWANKQRGKSP